ncbi:MAG TPA: hypothetical protein VFB39_07105 [Solirubrobacteraceae bacterium]|nr:hypothetical protein [Solirubrobacteraceae bacterium]
MSITRLRLRFPSPALIVACLALFAALGGSTYAATQSSASRIHFTNAALKNHWKPASTTNPQLAHPGYAKDSSGVVHLRGALFGGTDDTVAFVLPKGRRPSHALNVLVFSQSGVAGGAVIQRNGDVLPFGGNVTAFASLDGISFVAGE